MSVRPDNRLADAPMNEVTCETCRAQVLVRKSSWHQTSVQWTDDAVRQCTSWSPGDLTRDEFPSCEPLRASVARAAVEGRLPVLEEAEVDQEGPANS